MPRESLDRYYLNMLQAVAGRSTCQRRQMAAIITDVHGHILSTGFNGVPSGYPHCTDTPCPGVNDPKGNTERCMAIHAEQNAMLQCAALERAHVMYCSASPCFTCAKLIANTRIRRVIYRMPYTDDRGLLLLQSLGRELMSLEEVERWEIACGNEILFPKTT